MKAEAQEKSFGKLVFTVGGALAASFVAAELVGANRYLRTAIQGRAFWYYLLALLVVLGVMIEAVLQRGIEGGTQSLIRLLVGGAVLGFVASVVAISVAPLVTTGSISATLNAWKDPIHLIAAAFLGLGWLYGTLAGLTLYFARSGRYWHIGILMLACVGIKLLSRYL
jgi:hypothetical protein